MKNKYANVALLIIDGLGGKDNIIDLTHCMTRLRFILKDKKKVNVDELKSIDKVVGVNSTSTQYQVIIGNEVGVVFNALVNEGINTNGDIKTDIKNENKKNSILNNILDTITGCMTPMIPALTASGMIKVILSLCTTFNWLSSNSSTYRILDIIGDVAFYFMPIILAINAAKKFNVNTSIAVIVVGVFLHPNFSAWVSSGDPISFIGVPIQGVIYAASVIPALLTVWMMSYIEKFIDKLIPSMLKTILNPTLVLLISAPIALIVIGPIGNFLGEGLASIISLLQGRLGFVMVCLLAALMPFIVMTGMHHALTPIFISAFATTGQESLILIAQVCANLAQGGATLAVALKSKDSKMKQLASAAWISAIMGITEPALYGVTLKLKKPAMLASIGAGIAGLFAGINHVTLYVPQNSIMAVLGLSGEKGTSNIVNGLIVIFIALVAPFIMTYVFGVEKNVKESTDKLRKCVK
ncbi:MULTISPECIES: PTS transporter subunit EIIC [unclassified Clostridioides]|uniref:PTS transporter subunit EIIC n=1 Tax=unclassified Clostridioides TaxID=2635829 RepID=UPI001D113F25|nr:PTS transporter subunit EIIC [Clostridioides sp. ES-S-0171-01]MCC0689898.1 PTS transporter subunit EIIC [Clostridioides sp. ES-S-0056-01]UDN54217.1 PTS transporter subunit EIIC [Clostridioides sp. ES-S-0054-01]